MLPVSSHAEADPAGDRLLRLVDAGLVGLLVVAPLLMGGRYPVGRLAYVVLCVALAAVWFARQAAVEGTWIRSPVDWLVPAALLLVTLQLLPLSPTWIDRVSPHTAEVLPLFGRDGSGFGQWTTISFTPAATRGGLAVLTAYGLLFWVVTQRTRRLRDAERLLRWIALATIGMAAFGLLQYVTSNGKFFWVFAHASRGTDDSVKGTFINGNHYAHLLALGVGPLLVWTALALRGRQNGERTFYAGRQAPLLAVGLAVVLLAGLMAFSRGGALAIGLALGVASLLLARRGLVHGRHLAGLAALATVVAVSLEFHGGARVADELDDFAAVSIERLDAGQGRRNIWAANVAALRDHRLLGTGVGSHAEVYPFYYQRPGAREFTHAESGYLQVASETGLAGLFLLGTALLSVLWWCLAGLWRAESTRLAVALAAVTAGLVASLVHSIFDFVWYIPGCMAMTVILAALALRLFQMADGADSNGPRLSRGGWQLACLLVLVCGGWLCFDRVGPALAAPHWNRFERNSRIALRERITVLRRPAAADEERRSAAALLTAEMVHDLEQAVRHDPQHARARILLAGLYLRRFDQLQRTARNALNLSQIRDAAIASQFADRAQLDAWLTRAVGDNRQLLTAALEHIRSGLALSPAHGRGYLYLAELCFLEGGDAATKQAWLDHARTVRPHDNAVLFAIGKEAVLQGDLEPGLAAWRICFERDPMQQARIISLLAGRVPVQFLLSQFQPDLQAFPLFVAHYLPDGRPEERQALVTYFSKRADEAVPPATAATWLALRRLHRGLGDAAAALAAAEAAFRADVRSHHAHLALGESLLAAERFAEAETHLRWCQTRRPGDQRLRAALETAVKGRLRAPTRTAGAAGETKR